jgi:hypothetical protein
MGKALGMGRADPAPLVDARLCRRYVQRLSMLHRALQCAQDKPKVIELIDDLGAALSGNGVAQAPHQGPHIKTKPGKHKHDTTWQTGRRRHRYLYVSWCPTVGPDQVTLLSSIPRPGATQFCSCRTLRYAAATAHGGRDHERPVRHHADHALDAPAEAGSRA